MTRVDALLTELSLRHRNDDPRFLAAVRPIIERIVDPSLPEDARVPLLELLAETFERDVQVRLDLRRMRQAWDRMVADLLRVLAAG
ncbi:MAG: hypothetical protein Q7T30_02005 [Planctomycetota bacterium]|nr:hypothetical protein [Planctomycetota bacterium]